MLRNRVVGGFVSRGCLEGDGVDYFAIADIRYRTSSCNAIDFTIDDAVARDLHIGLGQRRTIVQPAAAFGGHRDDTRVHFQRAVGH